MFLFQPLSFRGCNPFPMAFQGIYSDICVVHLGIWHIFCQSKPTDTATHRSIWHVDSCWWFRNPKQPREMYKSLVNNGINYQPQLLSLPDFSHQPTLSATSPGDTTHTIGLAESNCFLVTPYLSQWLIVGLVWWFGIQRVPVYTTILFITGSNRNPNHWAPNQQAKPVADCLEFILALFPIKILTKSPRKGPC